MRLLLCCCLIATLAAPARSADAKGDEFFEKQIRPILADNCQKCHGEKKAEGGLRLTSRAALLKGGASGPAVVSGEPEKSLLVKAVRYLDDLQMPPDGKLPHRDIELLEKWVKMGAPWPGSGEKPITPGTKFTITDEQRRFWSWQPIKAASPPDVRDPGRARTPIDRFILARLDAKRLRPAPEADRRMLIRRLSFDLLGLPPSVAEVEAFADDPRPDAYERLVDRLLASPAYGERWGRHWLDLVRYTDSFDARGLGGNEDCADAWRYRDWVVRALNADMGYDRFTAMQVAGDVLSDRFDRDGIVATGMLAIGNWGGGDADKEKLLTDIADDQVDVVTRTFLGLTVSCARCHDHKFDPISTADYYGLAGIFFSTHILPNVGPKTNGPPMMRIPLLSPAELAQREAHAARVTALAKQVEAARARAAAEHARRMLPESPRYLLAAFDVMHPEKGKALTAEAAAKRDNLHLSALNNWLKVLREDNLRPLAKTTEKVGGHAGVYAYRGDPDCPNVLVNTTNQTLRFSTITAPPRSVCLHPGPASGAVAAWTSPVSATVKITGGVADADAVCGDGIEWRLVSLNRGELARGEVTNGGKQDFPAKPLESVRVDTGERIELVILPRREYTCDTTAVRLTIRRTEGKGDWDLVRDTIAEPLRKKPSAWSFFDTVSLTLSSGSDLSGWKAAVAKVKEGRAGRDTLRAEAEKVARRFRRLDANNPFWVSHPEDEAVLLPAHRDALARMRGELEALRKTTFPPLEYANGAKEGGVPGSPHDGVHDVRVHLRGRYDRLGDLVPRRFPEVLAGAKPTPIKSGSGRRELAAWLADPKNPLPARVMANRLWQFHFGRGIVNTPSNFGKLGERPTHPDLLDWLATEFVRTGWSMKHMHRLIVLSATYRQDSVGDEATAKADPDNVLLGRMPRRRLEAEAIRDNLLSVAGNLDRTPGGKATRDFNALRRSLYLMTVRSDRSGFGPLFDVADSTAPVDKRTVSTVAPQALFLLNNEFSQAQAKALTRRVLASASDDKARIEFAHRLLYGRPPVKEEVALALEYLAKAGRGESAWGGYCQVLLCANEFVYVE